MSHQHEEITLTFIASTENALLLSDGDIEEWIPLSQIKDLPLKWFQYEKNKSYEFMISAWILINKGFV